MEMIEEPSGMENIGCFGNGARLKHFFTIVLMIFGARKLNYLKLI